MTGSLQIKNNKYYIVLNTYEGGKRKLTWISTGLPAKGNKRKAEQMLREKIQEYEQSPHTPKSDILLSAYIRHWLTIAQRRVDPVTYQGYEVNATSHILPYFDQLDIRLQDVTRPILQAYFDEKATNGRKDGTGGLSPRTLQMHKNVLHQTLKEAVKEGLLPGNPCQDIELPRQERFPAKAYSASQLQALFDAIRDEPLYPVVYITTLYGLRRSEVLGLKWDSIDFENNLLIIQHTVSKVTKAIAKDKTKNQSSRRAFPLMPEAKAIFLAAEAAAKENRLLFGRDYHENDYVFKWPNGDPFTPDYVSHAFGKLLNKNHLPHIRFHDLRHSCASLLLNQGFTLKDVQEWMGHADIKMTANIYGHLDAARKQSMADQLSGSLFK